MDLIAASYNNIGPFKDQTITVNFHPWKYLIKAPIWSGKSFLFFDGPFYALYKYSTRQMLHRTSTNWFIHLLFEHEGQYWLIERTLKPTKAWGESTQSRLYTYTPSNPDQTVIDPLSDAGYKDIIIKWVDIKQVIQSQLEEIQFTNQKELDSHLGDLLPPQEVALSIHFLMQDAENVFELQPAQRVQVFKHLFGLVGIDHAKEIISTKRKELQTTIKVKGDTEQSSIKLRTAITTVVTLLNGLESITQIPKEIVEVIQKIITQSFFSDIKLIQENIQIEQFSIEDIDQSLFDHLQTEVDNYKAMAAGLQGKLDQLEQTLASGESDVASLRTQIVWHEREFDQLSFLLEKIDSTKIQALKKQKQDLEVQLKQTGNSFDSKIFEKNWHVVTTLESASLLIKKLKIDWEWYNENIKRLEREISDLKNRDKEDNENITQYEERLKVLLKNQEEGKFHCDLDHEHCHYVKSIIEKEWDLSEQESIKNKISNIVSKIADRKKRIVEIQSEVESINLKKTNLIALFEAVNRKQLETDASSYSNIQQKISLLNDELTKLEHEIEQQATAKEKQSKLQATIEAKQEQLEQITAKQWTSKELLQQYRDQVSNLQLDQIVRVEKWAALLQASLSQIASLIHIHKENQLVIKQLQEQEQMAKELYTIFSKELMVVVLQDFLPVLEQVINENLAKMVDYEIRFTVPEATDEKMELDITVIDQHGEREVKSLSGGQKAIIKIAWILAVSVLMKSKFLLLDETITSMDVFTIAKVADVLEDFVKSKQMKFYVVTHSPQIQEMTIWDRTVEVV